MALIRERDGKRLHVKSRLMGESLVSKSFIEELEIAPQQRLFPDVNILKIGGQSICDRGIKVLPNVIKEIVANKVEHKMLITTGGGTRSRHIYTIGLELGMPTGIIAKFGSSVSEQNALLISMLLSPWGESRSAMTRSSNSLHILYKVVYLLCMGCLRTTILPFRRQRDEFLFTAPMLVH